MSILEKLINIIEETFPDNNLTKGCKNLEKDLDLKQFLSSMDLVNLLINLEEEYDIVFEDMYFDQNMTINYLSQKVEKLMGAK